MQLPVLHPGMFSFFFLFLHSPAFSWLRLDTLMIPYLARSRSAWALCCSCVSFVCLPVQSPWHLWSRTRFKWRVEKSHRQLMIRLLKESLVNLGLLQNTTKRVFLNRYYTSLLRHQKTNNHSHNRVVFLYIASCPSREAPPRARHASSLAPSNLVTRHLG